MIFQIFTKFLFSWGLMAALKTLSYVGSFSFTISRYLLFSQQNSDMVVEENSCNAAHTHTQMHLGVFQTLIHYLLPIPLPVARLTLCLL